MFLFTDGKIYHNEELTSIEWEDRTLQLASLLLTIIVSLIQSFLSLVLTSASSPLVISRFLYSFSLLVSSFVPISCLLVIWTPAVPPSLSFFFLSYHPFVLLVAAAAPKSLQSCPTLHRRQPTRLPHPWDSPGKNTGVGCHFLLQCMKVKSESEGAQSCPTLRNPMDCSLPGSSTHGIFQARVLEWGAIAFSGFIGSYI